MANVCDPSTQAADTGGLTQVPGQPGLGTNCEE